MSLSETRTPSGDGNVLAGRVAVVIPAHDHGRFVVESIRSALAQGDRVAEVIVVDDGSGDGTVEQVRGLGDSRVRLLRHDVSKGPSAARNTGWRASRTEWVFFLDADDTLAPGALGALLDSSGLGLSHECSPIPYGYQEVYALGFEDPPRFTACLSTRSGSLLEDIAVNYRASIFVALIPRRCLEEMGGFNEGVRHGEDFDFALRLAGLWTFRYVPVPTYRARMHATNRHRTFTPEAREEYVATVRRVFGRWEGLRQWSMGRRALAHQYWILGQEFSALGEWRRARLAFGRAWRECPWKLGAWQAWLRMRLRRSP